MRGKKLIAAFAAIYIIPFVFLLVFMLAAVMFLGSQSSTNNQQTQMDQQINTVPGITRKEVIDTALTLVGKVKYFWGGHSDAGYNGNWGTPMLVTAAGDGTSGTYQPYGLDCSGFIDWVYKTSGYDGMYGTTANQLKNTYPISENDLKPGDLVFRFDVEGSEVNHVGIFYKKENGVKYYIHCQGGTGVIMNASPTFQYWRRPYIKFEDD